jgi:alanine racemase
MIHAEARLTVDLDALAANHTVLCALAGAAEVAPVVKADAYGVGVAPVARRLRAAGARSFFVARVSEGEDLRRVLGGEAKIYVLDGCPPGAAARLAADALTPVLNSVEQIQDWGDRTGALHVDTGLNRLGVTPAQARALAAAPQRRFDLLISHLSCADAPDHPMNARQRDAFALLRTAFPATRASLANSGGLFIGGGYLHDVVRPGITLYGGGPFEAADPRIRPVVTLEAPILQVREAAAGEPVGYGAAYVSERPTRIAIVAAGHADGVLRSACPAGKVWFAGAKRAVLGRVSMDLIAVDVTGCPAAQPGALVEVLGAHMLLDDVAAAAGTISYEILTRLSPRAGRRWRGRPA